MNQSLTTVLAAQPNVGLVCALGVLVVFAGLIAIVGLVAIMNAFCDLAAKKSKVKEAPKASAPAAAAAEIPNRQEILAAVCAAVAEENGTDISAIRVISFKKL